MNGKLSQYTIPCISHGREGEMHLLLGAIGGFHAQYQVNDTLPHSKEMGLLCTLRGGILLQE